MPLTPTIGTRIELHPATDRWMMGDRFGTINGMDKPTGCFRVKMDTSGRVLKVPPDQIGRIGSTQVVHTGNGTFEPTSLENIDMTCTKTPGCKIPTGHNGSCFVNGKLEPSVDDLRQALSAEMERPLCSCGHRKGNTIKPGACDSCQKGPVTP